MRLMKFTIQIGLVEPKLGTRSWQKPKLEPNPQIQPEAETGGETQTQRQRQTS
jgi:hypothetical protein